MATMASRLVEAMKTSLRNWSTIARTKTLNEVHFIVQSIKRATNSLSSTVKAKLENWRQVTLLQLGKSSLRCYLNKINVNTFHSLRNVKNIIFTLSNISHKQKFRQLIITASQNGYVISHITSMHSLVSTPFTWT